MATKHVLRYKYQSLRRNSFLLSPTHGRSSATRICQQRWKHSTSLMSNTSFSPNCDEQIDDDRTKKMKNNSLTTFLPRSQQLKNELYCLHKPQPYLSTTTRQISSVTDLLPEFAKQYSQYSIWHCDIRLTDSKYESVETRENSIKTILFAIGEFTRVISR